MTRPLLSDSLVDMGEQAIPTKPGWYPHRYGDEGKESYWDGREWTGERVVNRVGVWVWGAAGVAFGVLLFFVGLLASTVSAGGGWLALAGALVVVLTVAFGATTLIRRQRGPFSVSRSAKKGAFVLAGLVAVVWLTALVSGWSFGASIVVLACVGALAGGVVAFGRWRMRF